MTTTQTDEHVLETGWRPTTPSGDNLLLDFTRTGAAGFAALAVVGRGRREVVDDIGMHMTDAGSPSPFGNVAHLTSPLAAGETERLVARLYEFYAGGDGGPFLLFSPAPTQDLRPFGFHLEGHPPFMVRPISPIGTSRRFDVSGIDVVEATTRDTVADFERTLIDGYPAPELSPYGTFPRLFADEVLGTGWRLFVGYDDGRPVATSAAYVGDAIVAIEAISTLPSHRGRGIGAALTVAAMLAEPSLPSALVASDLGRGVYESLGFLSIHRYTLWIGMRDHPVARGDAACDVV